MKKYKILAKSLTLAILALLLITIPVLASYYATIQIQESNGNSYTYLPVITDINNSYLATNGYISSTGLDTRVLYGETELTHLVASDKLIYVIPSLEAYTTLEYRYASGYSALSGFNVVTGYGGLITASDHADLELGSRFKVEVSGYFDTDFIADKNIINKYGAFRTWISAEDQISASVDQFTLPTGNVDSGASWNSETSAYDDNTGTYADETVAATSWGNYLELTHAALDAHGVSFYASGASADISEIDLDAYYDSAWHDIYEGSFTQSTWQYKSFSGEVQEITSIRAAFYNEGGSPVAAYLHELEYIESTVLASATSISSGEHDLELVADGTNLYINVDDSMLDSDLFGTNSVPDINLDWTFASGNSMPYIEYIKFAPGHIQSFFPLTTPVEIVDTGMPDPADYEVWKTLNLRTLASLPASATGAVFHVEQYDTSSIVNFGARITGCTDDIRTVLTNDGGSSGYAHLWGITGVNTSGQADFYIKLQDHARVWIIGYTELGVTYLTSKTDKSPVASATWELVDCSSEAPNAVGLIFEIWTTGPSMAGLRKTGSTDNRYADVTNHSWFIVGCDGSQQVDIYKESAATKVLLIGYISAGATFNTNATDKSIGSTGSWTDILLSPTTMKFAFMEVYNGGDNDYGLRKNDTSEEIYQHSRTAYKMGIIEPDNDGYIEGKVESLSTDYYLVGYANAPSTTMLWYEPIQMIDSGILPDRAGTAQNGTITWGTNPAGISDTLGEFVSSVQPTPAGIGQPEAEDRLGPVTQPGWFNTDNLTSNPFYPLVDALADASTFTVWQIWTIFATMIVASAIALVYAKLRNLMLATFMGTVATCFFVAIGIYPWWIIVIFAFVDIAAIVFERKPVI